MLNITYTGVRQPVKIYFSLSYWVFGSRCSGRIRVAGQRRAVPVIIDDL